MSQSCCLKYSEIKAKCTPSNSQIFATAVNKLPPGETPKKYPHNDTLNEKCVVMKQLIEIKVYLEASGCRNANATPSRGIFRL